MASASVTGAVIERYEGFTIAATVPIWFHEAPASASLPYVVLVDFGTVPEWDFEHTPMEQTTLEFHVYHTSLAAADAVASAIRYNGGDTAAGAGMDFAAALPLAEMELKRVERKSEQRFAESPRGAVATPVFRVVMRYVVDALRTA